MFYTYIIFSKIGNIYYKGFTQNLEKRIIDHINGESKFTSQFCDWVIVYSKSHESKKEAIIEEKRLKKLNRNSIEKLIQI
jgi:putative endonuclease